MLLPFAHVQLLGGEGGIVNRAYDTPKNLYNSYFYC